MLINNQYVKEINSISSTFEFEHKGNVIDINIHSTMDKDGELKYEIIDFDKIIHYFVNDDQEFVSNLAMNEVEIYKEYYENIHDNLMGFFLDSETIKPDVLMQIFEKNQ